MKGISANSQSYSFKKSSANLHIIFNYGEGGKFDMLFPDEATCSHL